MTKTIILSLILLLLIPLSFIYSIEIISIQINSIPLHRLDGSDWDSFFGGPDVFFTIIDSNGETIYKSDRYQDVEKYNFPLTYNNINLIIDNLDEQYRIIIFDHDVTKNEVMDSSSLFYFTNKLNLLIKSNLNHKITIKCK